MCQNSDITIAVIPTLFHHYLQHHSYTIDKLTSVGMGTAKSDETRYIGMTAMVMSEFWHMTTSFNYWHVWESIFHCIYPD